MKSRICSFSKRDQEAMQRITKREVDKEISKHHHRFYQQALLVLCWTLYQEYGWRNIRLVRLLKLHEENAEWLLKQYGDDWEFTVQKFLRDKAEISFKDIPTD